MKKIIALLSAIILVGVSATVSAAAFNPKTTTVLKDGAVTLKKADGQGEEKGAKKASKVDAKYCIATPFVAVEKTGNLPGTITRFTYFATPASCVNIGISFYGALETIEYVGAIRGVAYYKGTPPMDEPLYAPVVSGTSVGDDVFVYDETPIEVVIGNDTLVVYPGANTILSGTIIGDGAYAVRESPSACGPSGCRGTTSEAVGWGYKIVDNGWFVPPGTAVLNDKNQTVGIVFGPDRNRTPIATSDMIINGMYELNLLDNSGGGKG